MYSIQVFLEKEFNPLTLHLVDGQITIKVCTSYQNSMRKLHLIQLHNHCNINTSGEHNTNNLLIYYVTNPCNLFPNRVTISCWSILMNVSVRCFWLRRCMWRNETPHIFPDTNLNAFSYPIEARSKKKSNTFAPYGGVNPVRINWYSEYIRFQIKHKIRNGIRQTFRSCNTHERD